MLATMRRLHPRGAANRGICVDAEGAMLGPDCVLVRRTRRGFRPIDRDDASQLQKCLLGADQDEDWLFRQCRSIADALDKGEIALAQIYGLRIPLDDLDAQQLERIALAKTGLNPDEPRIPKGDPHGGEWTTGDGGGSEAGSSDTASPQDLLADFTGNGDSAGATLLGPDIGTPNSTSSPGEPGAANGQSAPSDSPPIRWEMKPLQAAPAAPPAADGNGETTTFGCPDVEPNIPVGSDPAGADETALLDTPGIDAINPDYSIENLLFLLATGGFGRWSSQALMRALVRLGITRVAETDTHHIVAGGAQRADPARKVLERFGISLDDPANGVFLPETQHDHLHTTAYYEGINRELEAATSRSDAEQILRSIARRLAEGSFP
jgi:hypothetical protein